MLIVFQDLTVPAAFCFATGMYATGSVPVLLVGTTPPQWLVHAGHTLNRAIATVQRHVRQAARDAALTVAALLILTIPTGGNQ